MLLITNFFPNSHYCLHLRFNPNCSDFLHEGVSFSKITVNISQLYNKLSDK